MQLSKELFSLIDYSNQLGATNAELISSSINSALKKLIEKFAPSGKVLFVGYKNKQEQNVKFIEGLFKQVSFNSVLVCLDGYNGAIDFNQAVYLNSFSEDVRLIISLESSLNAISSYFAHVNKVPLAVLVTGLNCNHLFLSKVCINNNNHLDYFSVCPKCFYVLDDKLLLQDKDLFSVAYASVESKLTALYDFRIYVLLGNNEQFIKAYSMLKSAVTNAFNVFNSSQKERLGILTNCVIQASLANAITDGKLFYNSSAFVAGGIYGELTGNFTISNEFYASIQVLCFFADLTDKINSLNIMDYNKRAEMISEICKLDQTAILQGYLNQQASLVGKKEAVKKILLKVKQETSNSKKLISSIKNTYLALGGNSLKDNKNCFAKAIKYSGDFPNTFNVMTMLRERGILDLIKD